jgi:hypothetical protein
VLQGRALLLDADELPISVIDPGGTYRIMAVFAWQDPGRFRLRIEWTDGTGRRENILPLSRA